MGAYQGKVGPKQEQNPIEKTTNPIVPWPPSSFITCNTHSLLLAWSALYTWIYLGRSQTVFHLEHPMASIKPQALPLQFHAMVLGDLLAETVALPHIAWLQNFGNLDPATITPSFL